MKKPNLVYTIALDPPGSTTYRRMATILVSSLLRSAFDGEILVFRNTPEPLFEAGHENLREVHVDDADPFTFKFRVQSQINGRDFDRILFLDCDCLVLRNVDHLLVGEWDIAWQPELGKPIQDRVFRAYLTPEEDATLERDGANSGVWAVRGERYNGVLLEWERIYNSPSQSPSQAYDQPAWNRLLLDFPVRKEPLEHLEVMFPMYLHPLFKRYRDAAIVHVCGISLARKLEFLLGLYLQIFQRDEALQLVRGVDP